MFIDVDQLKNYRKIRQDHNHLKENHNKMNLHNEINGNKKSFLQLEEKSVGFLNLTSPKLNCACKFVKDPNDDGLPKFRQVKDQENFTFTNFEKNEIQKIEKKEKFLEQKNNFNKGTEHSNDEKSNLNKNSEEKITEHNKSNIKELVKNEIAEMLGPSNKASTLNMLEFKEMEDRKDFKIFKMNKLKEQLNEFNLKKKMFQNGIYENNYNDYPSFFPSQDFALYQKYKKMKEFYKKMNSLENDYDLI